MDKKYFCFLDETGLLNRPEDRFFALGMIKCYSPHNLYLKIKEKLISEPGKYKQDLLKYFKKIAGIHSFYPEFSNNKFSILNFHHNKK